MYYQIITNNKNRISNHLFTYSSQKKIEIGSRVIVPFGRGNRLIMGLVVAKVDEVDFEVKEISRVVDDEAIISKELIELAFFMHEEYLSDLSSAFQTVLPPGNWQDIQEYFYSDSQQDDFHLFLNEKKTWSEIQIKFPSLSRKDLMGLVEKGKIEHEYGLSNDLNYKYENYVELIEKVDLETIPKNAKSQRAIIAELLNEGPSFQKDLVRKLGVSYSTFQALEKKSWIRVRKKRVFRNVLGVQKKYEKLSLNKEQEKAFESLRDYDKILLHGVTGSGKTEIYLQWVEEVIEKGKEAIVLVPEISLTPQTIERFTGRFNEPVAILHSKLSLMERFEQYRLIKEGKVKIVIGARSAIFAPFENLGIIIIDEEHELSYYSEQNPKYSALEIAEKRCDYQKAKLVLGSATPSISDYHKALRGDYQLVELHHRATSHPLPETSIIDMREELKVGNTSLLSTELECALENNIKKGEQSILFLNKRGHTSYVFCRRCGFVLNCQSCDLAMTYHKSKGRLICHLCGRTDWKPTSCPNCGSKSLKEFGAGTEKLEEEIKEKFPQARIFRMDSDTVQKKDSYEAIYRKMMNHEIDILIGTQMLSKGLDFPNVTVVGVISADLSLNMGNYLASERTFQLLTQVAGRAGRGEKKGNVYIQTYEPNHFAIRCAQNNDYKSFYKQEINIRRTYQYPPFQHIVHINCSHKNREIARGKAIEISKFIQAELNRQRISVLMTGPNPSPIDRINDYYRFDIYYKVSDNYLNLREIIKQVLLLNKYKIQLDGVRVTIQLNPVSFF